MDQSLLEQIGLTKSEINVYLALLELGSSSTGKIVEKSKASSSKIYEILDKLIQKGLASFIIKSGVKYFESASPDRILDYMEEKEKTLNKQKQELHKLLPELELKRQLSKYSSEATIYKGMKGFETAFYSALNLLKPGNEMLVISGPARPEHIDRFMVKFNKERAKRKVKLKVIWNEEARGQLRTLKENNPLSEVKYVPQTTSASIEIFNNRVLINPKTKEPLIITIDSKEVADAFRVQFENLWNQQVHTYEGHENFEKITKNWLDSMKKGDEYYVLGAAFGISGKDPEYERFFAKYHEYRIKKEIRVKLLFQQGTEEVVKRLNKVYTTLSQVKFLPYKAKSPVATFISKNRILMIIQEKIPILIQVENSDVASAYMSHFESLWNQDVKVYKGFDDVTKKFASMLDILEEGEEYYVLGATYGKGGQRLRKWFLDYHTRRVKKNIHAKLLSMHKEYSEVLYELTNTGDKEMKTSQVKPLPPDFQSPMQINLYKGNKVLMFLFGEELMCFEIDSKILYDNFRNYFDILWNQETHVVKGLDAIQKLFEEMLVSGHGDFIGARGYFFDFRPDFIDDWEKRAIKSGFTMRNLVDIETKGHRITTFPFVKTKYTLPKEFTQLSVFWIYGNKVAIANWVEKEPTAIVIENKNLHDMYKQQFELLWNKDKF